MRHKATNTRWLKEYRKKLNLSIVQKDFLIGTLLGDGHLQPSRSGLLARLQIRHSIKFKDYVDWQYQIWRKWTLKEPTFDACNNSIVLRSIFHPEFSVWRNIFYLNNKKIVPVKIGELLNHPYSLAIWFMDDGNGSKQGRWLRLSTYAFGLEGNIILQNCLKINFGLDTKIYNDGKGNYLWFPKTSALKLYELIRPYILQCMEYKFNTLKLLTP